MILFLSLLFFDQYCKYIMLNHPLSHIQYPFFKLTLVKNHGVTLGYLGGFSWLLIASIQIVLLVWILTLDLSKPLKTFLLAGGISNLIDRLYYGYVIDYIHFQMGNLKWPAVVNLADIYLCIAGLLWFYQYRKSL